MPGKKKKTKNITRSLAEFHISTLNETKIVKNEEQQKIAGASLVFSDKLESELREKWPMPRYTVPEIFLHKPINFAKHERKLLAREIHFDDPVLCQNSTKIGCPSFDDHKAMVQYFNQKKIPYNTFGHPFKRKMKVVIRGLTKDVDINELKSELKGGSLPIVRIHKMHRRKNIKDDEKPLILVVVPNDDEGRKLLLLERIFGFDVTLEPVKAKTKQCYRCQMWGHSQRYCRGEIKCVKCAKNHFSKKCDRNPKDPIKCANCGQEGHVASWRNCPSCPDYVTHKLAQERKKVKVNNIYLQDGTCACYYEDV